MNEGCKKSTFFLVLWIHFILIWIRIIIKSKIDLCYIFFSRKKNHAQKWFVLLFMSLLCRCDNKIVICFSLYKYDILVLFKNIFLCVWIVHDFGRKFATRRPKSNGSGSATFRIQVAKMAVDLDPQLCYKTKQGLTTVLVNRWYNNDRNSQFYLL